LIFSVKNAVLNGKIIFERTILYILLEVYANKTLNPDKFSIVIKLARKLLLLKLVRFAHNWNDGIVEYWVLATRLVEPTARRG
jgi:hypothetical protein